MMMSIQLKVWKRLITNHLPLSFNHQFISPLIFTSKPHLTLQPNFCSQTVPPSTTPPDRGVVTEFLLNKCGLSEEDIAKIFRGHNNKFLSVKSIQNSEEVLQLLNGCGLTTSGQIRRLVICNPRLLFLKSERNIKSKLNVLRTFMKEEDMSKLILRYARIFDAREDRFKSAILLLQRLGIEGRALSELVAIQPFLLMTSEENVMELFQQAEDLGFEKGSKKFAYALPGVGKQNVERKLQCLRCLGFSEKLILELYTRYPLVFRISEEKLKRNVDILVNSMGIPLADLVKYPYLFGYSLERKMIPRHRVMEALNSMQLQNLKRRLSLPNIFYLTEKCFLEKYVNKNAESSILLNIYHGGKAEELIIDKETSFLNQRDSRHGSSESSSTPSI